MTLLRFIFEWVMWINLCYNNIIQFINDKKSILKSITRHLFKHNNTIHDVKQICIHKSNILT